MQDFNEAILLMIQRINPQRLKHALGRTKATDKPLEGTYDHEFFRAAASILPYDKDGAKATLSVFVGQVGCVCVCLCV